MADKANQPTMCDDCQRLVGAGRRTGPHSKLVFTDGKKVSSMMGAADEAYFRCKTCGQEWLHETGSCGMGWVTFG